MKIAMIGLGKMGGNMTRKLLEKGYEMVVFDLNQEVRGRYEELGAHGARDIEEFIEKCNSRGVEVIWSMLPDNITFDTITKVAKGLEGNKVIVDGGNSYYKDTVILADEVKEYDHELVDAGTSGGVWGLEKGYCFMVGGSHRAYKVVEPILRDLGAEGGYAHMGPIGSGHYVKMVHNGIEYALMQSYGEGFELLKNKKDFDLDLERISKVWQNGSVIDSWLLKLCERMFARDGELSDIRGYVEDSGEGRWTVLEGIEQRSAAPLITLSLLQRFRSRREETFTDKVIAGLRNEFGGHGFKKREE